MNPTVAICFFNRFPQQRPSFFHIIVLYVIQYVYAMLLAFSELFKELILSIPTGQ